MEISDIIHGKPSLLPNQVIGFVEGNYNMKVKGLKPMAAYDGQTFHLETLDAMDEDDHDKRQFILKISNSRLSPFHQALEDINYLMAFLKTKGFPLQSVIRSRSGKLLHLAAFQNPSLNNNFNADGQPNNSKKDAFMVRMLSFIPGVTLNDLDIVPAHLFEEAGEILGMMQKTLQEIKLDPKHLKIQGEMNHWSLGRVCDLKKFLHFIKDSEKRRMAREIIDAFESKVLPKRIELRQGFVQGDFSDNNILVTTPTENDEVHINGVIDFDYASYTYFVYDLGISVMYLIQTKTPDIDMAAMLLLRGYSKHRKMTAAEEDCLYYCVTARFVQSLIYGLYNYSLRNDEYLLSTQVRGWDVLEELWTRGQEITYRKWGILQKTIL